LRLVHRWSLKAQLFTRRTSALSSPARPLCCGGWLRAGKQHLGYAGRPGLQKKPPPAIFALQNLGVQINTFIPTAPPIDTRLRAVPI
jgi:hypothetical protein